MIKIRLSQGMFMALLLASATAQAEQYPAADFQPKVIFHSEAAAAAPATHSVAGNSPCAPANAKTEETVIDPKFPAANFQPKVIYSDADAKHGS
jgi:hypothetical protein